MAVDPSHSILFVDDEVAITKALQRLFRREGYSIHTANSGADALAVLDALGSPVSLIISDQRMPGMNGAQFLEQAKVKAPEAIRFLLTGYSEMEAVVDAVNKGEIHRYLTKPWNDDDLLLQVRQALSHVDLVRENKRLLAKTEAQNRELAALNQSLEEKVKARTRQVQERNTALQALATRLERGLMDTVRLLGNLVETINPKLGKYMRHTGELARSVAEAMELPPDQVEQVELAGLVHDVGLLGLPERVIFADEEHMIRSDYKLFAEHPVIASMSFETMASLEPVGEIILFHHEWYNGKGFPSGLRGTEIPIGSRIIAAASAYCRIIDTWPTDVARMSDRAKRLMGKAAFDSIRLDEPAQMRKEIAEKALLMNAHQRFDFDVVTRLIQHVGSTDEYAETETRMLPLDSLMPGMTLVEELRLTDGRLLLMKGVVLKESTISAIRQFGERQLIPLRLRITSKNASTDKG